MSKFASAEMERLSVLLSEELESYEQIHKLTEQQTELLAKDDIEEFNNSLDEREKLIEKIKGLHQETDPLMQSYASFSSSEDGEDTKINEMKRKIRRELEACAKLNDMNTATMAEKLEEQTKKIDEQSSKRKGIGGYAQSVPNTPEMFDKKT